MRVKLINYTHEPIDTMWTAARTCYASKSPIDMWNDIYPANIDLLDGYDNGEKEQILEKHWKLVKTVLDSGHDSIAQHVYFTFAIEGISRACSHQLVRHRLAVFSQQSQRYVEFKEDANKLNELLVNYKKYNDFNNEQELREIVDKYFVIASGTDETFHGTETNDGLVFLADALLSYLIFTGRGLKAEDARSVLPNATKTNLVMTMNLSELRHVASLRLCTRSQKEIRDLFKLIKDEVTAVDKRLGDLLVPSCLKNKGICYEHKSCGRCPTIDEVMEVYNAYKQLKAEQEKVEND